MPIAPLTTTSINLPAPAREGRAREGHASREREESRVRPMQLDVEQRSRAKLPQRADQPDGSTQADGVPAAAAQEQQFLETLASQRARLSSVSAPFENLSSSLSTSSLSTSPLSTTHLSTMQSHALRSYVQTQNINTGNAAAGSELIVGIDTFV